MGGSSSDWDSSDSSSSSSSDSGSSSRYVWEDKPSVTRRSASSYAKEDKREYKGHVSNGIPAPIGKDITPESNLSAIFVVDVTGSMKEWPGLIFKKIPALYNEANASMQGLTLEEVKKKKSIEDLLELSIIAIGDASCDEHPLQVVDFAKGAKLVQGVNKIYPEGQGGPFGRESYELAAYYILNHCKPKGKGKPLVVFACDEDFYPKVKTNEIKKYIGDDLAESLDSNTVIKDLSKKYEVYVLRPEPQEQGEVYVRAQKHWEDLIGKQRVLKMNNPERLVDCFIGLCAYAADNLDGGIEILKRRQTKEQVQEVLETLHPLLKR